MRMLTHARDRARRFIGAWVIAVGLVQLSSDAIQASDDSDQDISADISHHSALLHKLRTLIIGEIDLRNATPKEALKELSDECIKSDPEHRGISFVGHFGLMDEGTRITLHLKNVSARQALKHLFDYAVGANVVTVGYDHLCEGLIMHTYKLPNGLYLLGPIKLGDALKKEYDVTALFQARGIQFPPGTSAVYETDKMQLVVTATSCEPLNLIDEILNP